MKLATTTATTAEMMLIVLHSIATRHPEEAWCARRAEMYGYCCDIGLIKNDQLTRQGCRKLEELQRQLFG